MYERRENYRRNDRVFVENMANSLPIDISILEDQVIEVTEMEDAMEECMMFVKKLSETSLTEMEKEKFKLQELLEKAEKEMKNMKQALKRSCSKRDEWRDKCLLERDTKAHLDRQLKEAKQRMQKMETAIDENKNNLKTLQQQKNRNAEAVKEMKERISAQRSAKGLLEDELAEMKKSLAELEKENEELREKLFKECQKSSSRRDQDEDRVIDLETQLAERKQRFQSFEKECFEKIKHVEEKLVEQQTINKRLSEEAEVDISAMEDKVKTGDDSLSRVRRCNEELRTKLAKAEKDVENIEGHLREVREENEIAVAQKEKRIRDLIEELKDRKAATEDFSENEGATFGNTARKGSADAKMAGEEGKKEKEKEESKSWANVVEEETLSEMEQKYNGLVEEHNITQRQFAHLKKHRNQILRENNELHYHVQMATLQLASGNTRFRQQMDQFRVRLQVAESMYEDKVLECNMLDNQLKQMYNGEVYPGEVYPAPGYV